YRHLLIIPLMLIILPAKLGAAPILREASRLDFTARQMGVPVRGDFKRFDADVRFDPDNAKNSRASITIYLDSIDAGSDEATVEIKRKPWFDVKNHPRAEFTSRYLTPLGKDQYMVAGKMTIKGATRDVSAPFFVKREKDIWLFEGKFILNRLAFGIGEGAWSDTDTVADEVEVFFKFYVPVPDVKNNRS
ncbi:MAG: YceI family protein, partial [Deltaproteobacteria bacterium]|nr:YceI family protein [Deltaproteobacteria bacterium]